MARNIVTWTVNGKDYRLKLTADAIEQVEKKVIGGKCITRALFPGDNLSAQNPIDAIPPLTVMLAVIQASAAKYCHGLDRKAVTDMFDDWSDDYDSPLDAIQALYMDVYSPLFTGSSVNATTGTEVTTDGTETAAE